MKTPLVEPRLIDEVVGAIICCVAMALAFLLFAGALWGIWLVAWLVLWPAGPLGFIRPAFWAFCLTLAVVTAVGIVYRHEATK